MICNNSVRITVGRYHGTTVELHFHGTSTVEVTVLQSAKTIANLQEKVYETRVTDLDEETATENSRLENKYQLSQRDRAAGWVSYRQKWKTVNGRQYFTDIIGRSSTTMT